MHMKYSYFQQLQPPQFINVAAWLEETNVLSLALKIFCNLSLPYLKDNVAERWRMQTLGSDYTGSNTSCELNFLTLKMEMIIVPITEGFMTTFPALFPALLALYLPGHSRWFSSSVPLHILLLLSTVHMSCFSAAKLSPVTPWSLP